MLIDYTTFDDIRSALGVSSDELEDTTLELETWDYHLQADLEGISATLTAGYAAVVAVAAGSRTAAQAKLYRATRLYATLSTANALAASLPMFGPKDVSDGKALVSRFADAPYKAVVKSVREQYETAGARLKQAWAELSSSTSKVTVRSYMGVSSPATDPVTG